eukprot:8177518-Pyramimonas_sp.AAC.1
MLRAPDVPWLDHACHGGEDPHEAACKQAEKVVHIRNNAELQTFIRDGKLHFDKREKDGYGLTLGGSVWPLNEHSAHLRVGDLLVAQDGLRDVAKYANLSPPIRLVLWRRKDQTLCTRRCPFL